MTLTAPRPKLERVANALSKHPAVRGLVSITNDRRDGAIVPSGASAQVLFGHGHLVEELAGLKLAVGAGEFVQVNRAQAHAMYARATELAIDARRANRAASSPGVTIQAPAPVAPTADEPLRGLRAVDLYAGLGGFGLHLARAGAAVAAVEIDREAIAHLRRAAERANLPLTPIGGDAGDIPEEIRAQLGQPDLVVVNPPRKGLSPGTHSLLGALAPSTIVYVSCGPDSLGRDLVALSDAGYIPDVIEPYDLMPGTAQVETLVRLRR